MSKTPDLSRRSILGGLAVTGAAAVGCGGDPPPAPSPDINPLTALLTAEYEAVKAYEDAISILRSPPAMDPDAAQSAPVAAIATRWQNHHREHAELLVRTLRGLGATPVLETAVMFTPPPTFVASVRNVLRLACNKERAAAVAYNRAVKALTAAGNRHIAANIEGDETQHFIVLYALLKGGLTPDVVGLVSNIGEIVPKSFVQQVTPQLAMFPADNGLTNLMDFAYM